MRGRPTLSKLETRKLHFAAVRLACIYKTRSQTSSVTHVINLTTPTNGFHNGKCLCVMIVERDSSVNQHQLVMG